MLLVLNCRPDSSGAEDPRPIWDQARLIGAEDDETTIMMVIAKFLDNIAK